MNKEEKRDLKEAKRLFNERMGFLIKEVKHVTRIINERVEELVK